MTPSQSELHMLHFISCRFLVVVAVGLRSELFPAQASGCSVQQLYFTHTHTHTHTHRHLYTWLETCEENGTEVEPNFDCGVRMGIGSFNLVSGSL